MLNKLLLSITLFSLSLATCSIYPNHVAADELDSSCSLGELALEVAEEEIILESSYDNTALGTELALHNLSLGGMDEDKWYKLFRKKGGADLKQYTKTKEPGGDCFCSDNDLMGTKYTVEYHCFGGTESIILKVIKVYRCKNKSGDFCGFKKTAKAYPARGSGYDCDHWTEFTADENLKKKGYTTS